ncbi:MAG: hypothetical protein C0190_01430, partial [Thermodesulfobacterium geofontis]
SDAKRTISILKENHIPVLGVVKNMAGFFEDETSFQNFLKEQRLNLLFEIPILKELSKTENLWEVFKTPEKEKFLNDIAERILDKVFRIH